MTLLQAVCTKGGIGGADEVKSGFVGCDSIVAEYSTSVVFWIIILANGSLTKSGAPAETPGSLDDLVTAAGLIIDETGVSAAVLVESVDPGTGDDGVDCCLIRLAACSFTVAGDV